MSFLNIAKRANFTCWYVYRSQKRIIMQRCLLTILKTYIQHIAFQLWKPADLLQTELSAESQDSRERELLLSFSLPESRWNKDILFFFLFVLKKDSPKSCQVCLRCVWHALVVPTALSMVVLSVICNFFFSFYCTFLTGALLNRE